MSFISIHYFLVLSLVVSLSIIIPKKLLPKLILIFSLYFYACFSLKYLAVLFYVIIITWLLSKKAKSCQKPFAIFSTLVILSPLLFLKLYINPWDSHSFLPLGISFFSLQAISYFFDVKKGLINHQTLFSTSLYLSFFPQLVVGPIERASDLIIKLQSLHSPNFKRIVFSFSMILIAIFKKQVLAERALSIIDFQSSILMVFLSTVLFGIYIYLDFSAYCQIARASALLFGIKITQNFKRPYFALNLKEFWKRWHISLRNFFVDYIYIPMGGNRSILSSFTVFFLSSIWHGVYLGFLLWGMSHFLFYIIEKQTSIKQGVLFTQLLVFFSWFLFYNPDFSYYFYKLEFNFDFSLDLSQLFILLTLFLYFIWEYLEEFSKYRLKLLRFSYHPTFQVLVILAIVLLGKFENTGFLYFRF
ncbi:MAG: hypothetical protein COB02_02040 [Candidatus Cloacimonadota bacterium]|nr:MAG: hypothetical protein COB02_02040 [Candidatus Cloacimonadota bacterium]